VSKGDLMEAGVVDVGAAAAWSRRRPQGRRAASSRPARPVDRRILRHLRHLRIPGWPRRNLHLCYAFTSVGAFNTDRAARLTGADMPQRFRLLTEPQVKGVLPMADLIPAMEEALARFSAGEVNQPVRTVLTVGPSGAFFGVMPAAIPHPPALGAKLVTVFNANEQRGLPSHLASILLFDPETGALLALMDGRYITEARTAAVSAVSARHLARAEAGTLALIGSGVQARSHLEAMVEVRALRDVRVWSPRAASRDRFVSDMAGRLPGRLRAVDRAEDAVRGADVIVLATSSPSPVIEDAWVGPGAHVVSVGACRPDQREMDPALVARARLFVDSRAAALVESGDVVQGIREGRFAETHVAGELGQVVLHRVTGRRGPEDVTVFKSLGMAVEDVVSADLVLRRAVESGVGAELTL
jgi:ornithine cyclodeaminase/alanine dehydrogenase-like protein (mu-crystallin family)